MPAPILETSVRAGSITLILADNPDPEAATLSIQGTVHLAVDRGRPLAEAQAEALRQMRDAISEQIQEIANMRGRSP